MSYCTESLKDYVAYIVYRYLTIQILIVTISKTHKNINKIPIINLGNKIL